MSDVKAETRMAKVVNIVDPVELAINRGARQGIKIGDRFLVFGDGPRISDPDTGEDLGQIEPVRGRGEVVHVQDHLATIRSIERRRTHPTKRIVRERTTIERAMLRVSFGLGNLIEEELALESEKPFEAVRLGDPAKPI